MERARRFSQLSPARRALVRIMQALNYGELLRIRVTDAEPVFDQASVVIDSKLDKDEVSRPELTSRDFELTAEVVRMMLQLDEWRNGTIQRIEVRAGIPRRLIFETGFDPSRWSGSSESE